MRFFTDKSQLKKACSALSVDFELESIRSFVDSAEGEVLAIIGEAAGTEILASASMLDVMRRVVADLALSKYASSGALLISNAGIQVATGSNRAPASDKKLLAFRKDAIDRAWNAFEQLIILMDRAAEGFDGWKASVERKAYFSILFSGSSEFGPFGGVQISASLYIKLRRQVEFVQDDYLEPVLGRTLLDNVIALNTTPSADTKMKQLQRLCMRVVAPLAVSDAIRYNLVQVNDGGVYELSVDSIADNVEVKSAVGINNLNRVLNRLTIEGEACLVKLNKFLRDNKAEFGDANPSVYPMQGLNDKDSGVYLM